MALIKLGGWGARKLPGRESSQVPGQRLTFQGLGSSVLFTLMGSQGDPDVPGGGRGPVAALLGGLASSCIFLTLCSIRLGSVSALADDGSSGHPWSLVLGVCAQTWLASPRERSGEFHHLVGEGWVSGHDPVSSGTAGKH